MADLGKVVVTDGGNYSSSATYEKLTFVHYQGDAYMTLKTVKGITPMDDGVNYRLFCKSAELATASKAGIVMPDGTTTTVDANGKISVKKATTSAAGIVKPAPSDFSVAADGTQKVNLGFSQASALANISTSDSWLTILGKIAKAIAAVITLNSNAFLKSELSGIDVNDSNKAPTSAFIHTLVERIGMSTSLVSGYTNLTEAVNGVKAGLDQANSNLTSALADIQDKLKSSRVDVPCRLDREATNVIFYKSYGTVCVQLSFTLAWNISKDVSDIICTVPDGFIPSLTRWRTDHTFNTDKIFTFGIRKNTNGVMCLYLNAAENLLAGDTINTSFLYQLY